MEETGVIKPLVITENIQTHVILNLFQNLTYSLRVVQDPETNSG